MHSKSVLRAVAGETVARRDDADYFPSYELISGPHSGGRYYEPNLRSVKREGVEFVMRHFAAGLGVPTAQTATRVPAAVAAVPIASDDDGELFCEEALLEAFAQPSDTTGTARLCLLGDSHMTFLSRALQRRGTPHVGKMVMNGSAWNKNLFHLDADEIFVPLEGAMSRQIWAGMLPFFTKDYPVPVAERIVISNIGLQTHVAARPFHQWGENELRGDVMDIDKALAYYRHTNRQRLRVIEAVLALGLRVIVLTDPPTQSRNAKMRPLLASIEAYESLAHRVLTELGCEVISVRELMGVSGFDGSEARYYRTDLDANGNVDWIHGDETWYDGVSAALMPLIELSPDETLAT
jgi:hypothetical protein